MSFIPLKILQLIIYITSLISIGAGFMYGNNNSWFATSILPVTLIIISALAKSEYSLNKLIDVKISALIWCIGSIGLAFLPYLLNFQSIILSWIFALISIFNLLAISFSKIDWDEIKDGK